ncbi:MAG: ribosome maturation factor RimP [Sandaracinaceae bacterium]|nr:ribosome maturation factor RimP [Sandaracinaceae bacterium]
MSTPTIDTLESTVEPVCRAHGVELVQVRKVTERGSLVLRVMIDRPGGVDGASGVTLADCQAVSRDLSPALDVHDVVGGAYRLEVSSPGLDRPLVRITDFERFAGKLVEIRTRAPWPDARGVERRKFKGRLQGIEGEAVRVSVDGADITVPHAEIAKANVVYEY